MLKEFRQFVLRGNVVDLAVGVVIGAAFSAIVNGFVQGLLNPIIALIGDSPLDKLAFTIGSKNELIDGVPRRVPNTFQYGLVLDATVRFLMIAAFVFVAVVKPVNHLMARLKPDTAAEETTRDCPACVSRIPRAATRCPFCTSEVPAT